MHPSVHNQSDISSGGVAQGNPAGFVGAVITAADRQGEWIVGHRHGLIEGDAVLSGIAGRLRRAPVERDAHGSQLAPERAMLKRGEQGVELGEVVAVVSLELVDLGDAGGKGPLHVEGRKREPCVFDQTHVETGHDRASFANT